MTGVVGTVSNYYELANSDDPARDSMILKDGHSTILAVQLASDSDELFDHSDEFVKIAQGRAGNGIDVYAVGDLSGDEAYGKIADEDLDKAEYVGLPVACWF